MMIQQLRLIIFMLYIAMAMSSPSSSSSVSFSHQRKSPRIGNGVAVKLPLLSTPSLTSSSPGIIKNFARGSALKCLADLSGGLPFEVWKSSVVLENIRANHHDETPASGMTVLSQILHQRGIQGLWSGCSARMVEGFFSGAVLLAAKEMIRKALTSASPVTIPPVVIGFMAGAGGGAAQAIVMAPTSYLVTATTSNGGSVLDAAQDILSREGIRGIYRGAPAVAARQATNWASRQGFTELVRPRIHIAGATGEIIAGTLGGVFSCWNTPFEVARIESQSKNFANSSKHHRTSTNTESNHHDDTLLETMQDIVKRRGVGGLYTGIVPRMFQSCYQTVFLVCIPRLMDA